MYSECCASFFFLSRVVFFRNYCLTAVVFRGLARPRARGGVCWRAAVLVGRGARPITEAEIARACVFPQVKVNVVWEPLGCEAA